MTKEKDGTGGAATHRTFTGRVGEALAEGLAGCRILRETEEALRASEERYAIAVRGTNDGIWDRDLITGEIFLSPQWKLMLGHEDHEIPNRPEEWETRIHPDDYRVVMETRRAYLEGEIPAYEIEHRLRHKDGSYRWVLARGACLRDSLGRPFRMAGSHTDITARKQAEKALVESEERYRTLFEESLDMIFMVDSHGRLMDVNPAGMRLLGYTREELAGLDLVRTLVVNRNARAVFRRMVAESGSVKNCETKLRRKDGSRVTVYLSASAMHGEGGRIIGYQGIARDLTEARRLQEQLIQAQKMESIGLLAGGIAHDFNNLLNGILGFAEIIQGNLDEGDRLGRDSIRQVLKAAGRAAELTRSLLAFSRRQVINPRAVLLDEIIDDTANLIRRIIGEDIELVTELVDRSLTVMADPGQIGQVLMNLATNARDAMPLGGRICITMRRVTVAEGSEGRYGLDLAGGYALVSMSDSGEGIDAGTIGRIFEPFFSTKEVGRGTGLGLSISYGIIRQHNGSILVESEPGRGTVFEIRLPLAQERPVRRRVGSSPAAEGGETILVAEDEEVVRDFLRKTLERAGYRVITADNGEDGVRRFMENRDSVSLVLSDVVMPKLNGREMLQEIRAIRPGTRFIFISGYTADIIQAKGFPEKGVHLMAKPFVRGDLLRKLREVLDGE